MNKSNSVFKDIPRFIYFTGVDGSGKSTYIKLLEKEFSKQGLKTKSVWLRFNYFLTKPILLFCRLIGLTRRPIMGEKRISVHDFYKAPKIGKLVQYLHLIDTYIYYFFKVYLTLKFTNTYVLCDRFVYDILADFIIENRDYDIPKKSITKYLLKLIPNNSKVIFLSVSKHEILRRKPSVLNDDEDYDLKYKVYSIIENSFDFKKIDNNSNMEYVYPIILKYIGFKN